MRKLLLLALLASAALGQARPRFLITQISYGSPDSVAAVLPTAINNQGQVTGYLVLIPFDYFPFFYSGGQTVQIPTSTDATASAINNHGVVVGGYDDGAGSFIWPGSLAPFGPAGSVAWSINNSGIVVGGPPAYVFEKGVLTDLGLGPSSVALSINNAGQVVGFDDFGSFLWQNGKVTRPPLTEAVAINNNGDILGYIQSASGIPQPVLDVDGLLTNIPLPAGTTDSTVSALNDRDHVVGAIQRNNKTIEPFLWNGKFWLLNSLIPVASGWVLQEVTGINNKGQIIGYGTLNGVEAAYILTRQ